MAARHPRLEAGLAAREEGAREEARAGPGFGEAVRVLTEATAELDARLARDLVSHSPAPGATRAHMDARYDLLEPQPLEAVASDLYEVLYRGIVHPNHPRHFGLFVPGVRAAGVVADALAALLNPQVGAWWYSPAANEIEGFVLDALAERIGFDPRAGFAHFTSGGSEANATAVNLALNRAFPEHRLEGLTASPRPILYASEQAHDSFVKIAHLAGIGRTAVQRIRTDRAGRMDVGELRRRHAHAAAGTRPFLVVATAGTTAAGAFDPLPELVDFCREHGLSLHVDAAWGGLALLVDELRPLVADIHAADTVTWDAHKLLPIPTGAGMFFARSRAGVRETFGVETGYIPETVAGTVDLYQHTLQWSRRIIGLKVFLTLAELGFGGVAALLRHQVDMGRRLRAELSRSGFVLVNDSPLPLVCFTHARIAGGERSADEVVARVVARGRAWLSSVRLSPAEPKVLRACITSHRTAPGDLEALVSEVAEALELPTHSVR